MGTHAPCCTRHLFIQLAVLSYSVQINLRTERRGPQGPATQGPSRSDGGVAASTGLNP